jgi:hypothetical protein
MKIIKIILYWIMVAAIVTGTVYSYQKVQFGRKIAMLYQLATGNTAMGGPGGGQPGMRPGGPQQGMRPGGEQGQMQPGQTGSQPQEMGQSMQEGQAPSAQGTTQGQPQMQGNAQGQFPGFQPGGEGGQRGNFQPGGREGGPPGGGPGGPPGGSWYKISLRNVGPYTCILAFFVLITCVIEKSMKRFSRKKSAKVNNAA